MADTNRACDQVERTLPQRLADLEDLTTKLRRQIRRLREEFNEFKELFQDSEGNFQWPSRDGGSS